MKIAIIEDEELAVERLELMLMKLEKQQPDQFPNLDIVAKLEGVGVAVDFFQKNPMPDVVLCDIQLADGLSFEIFERVSVTCPIIFTTAYNEYAIRAFKVNSIDYLLKPFGLDDLRTAFEKLANLRQNAPVIAPDAQLDTFRTVMQQLQQPQQKPYKTRFMVKIGEQLTAISIEDISYFYSEEKITWLRHATTGRKYPIDYNLESVEDFVPPQRFFRLNRKFIAAIESIKSVHVYSNSRLKVVLNNPPDTEDILISREKVQPFKEWLDS